MKNVLVTGGKGQLATCLKDITTTISEYNFIYVDVEDLDITKSSEIDSFFKNNQVAYCINCAAYTAVDKAETDSTLAEQINVLGVKNLALACKSYKAVLIHISTDFVFDGKANEPYTEEDQEKPLSVYGQTKLDGEKAIPRHLDNYFIVRTSWLYSEHGHNFFKTMLKLGEERNELSVVGDQIGSPTYAGDLALALVNIISMHNGNYGLYHFSNEGVASWYDFAMAIFDEGQIEIDLQPITTKEYPTPATRPKYSVLDKSKIKAEFGLQIPHWRKSLKKCLLRIQN